MTRLNVRKTRFHQCRLLLGTGALLAMSALTPSASASIIIDNFVGISSPSHWPVIQFTIGNSIVTETSVPGVLGGTRQSIIFGESFSSPGVDNNIVSIELGELNFTSTAGANGDLTLRYAGASGDLGVNFSAETGIQITFNSFNFNGGVAVPIAVVLNDGFNSATGNLSLTSAGAQTLGFNFASFIGIGSLDLSSINSVLVLINGSTGGAYVISEIAVVPAPGMLALMGVAGLASRRRRRRNV